MKASEAREIAEGVNLRASIYQTKLEIKRAADKGETFIFIHETPSEKLKTRLCLDGYSLLDVSKDGKPMWKISW